MSDIKTIESEHAENLYDGGNGDMEGPWCRVADIRTGSRRWLESRTLIVRHDDDTLWGLDYERGLTEEQENEFPWRRQDGLLPLTRMYGHETLTVRYSEKPPADPAVSEVLVDRVYEVLYAAIAGQRLIHDAVIEQYPPRDVHGLESGHVRDIAEEIARAVQALGGA